MLSYHMQIDNKHYSCNYIIWSPIYVSEGTFSLDPPSIQVSLYLWFHTGSKLSDVSPSPSTSALPFNTVKNEQLFQPNLVTSVSCLISHLMFQRMALCCLLYGMRYSQWDSLMINDAEMRHETEITKIS